LKSNVEISPLQKLCDFALREAERLEAPGKKTGGLSRPPGVWKHTLLQMASSVLVPFVAKILGHFCAAEDQPVETQHEGQ